MSGHDLSAQFWRDDALEKAASIVLQYGADPHIAQDIRALKSNSAKQVDIDPTSRGDLVAEKVRTWYEANRETWWQRHSPFGAGPDRSGAHADEFMLRFIGAVHQAEQELTQED